MAIDNQLANEANTEKNNGRKRWSAPVLTEVGIADMTSSGGNPGKDGLGSVSTLS